MARKEQGPSAEDLAIAAEIPAPSVEQLKQLKTSINKAQNLAAEIETVEGHLKQLNEEYQSIVFNEIPTLMSSAGIESFKMDDGTKVSIKDFINGSLPKDGEERSAALAWIVDVGAGELIKQQVALAFGRGDHKLAEQVRTALRKLKVEFEAKEGVHPQTLYNFVRERMKRGESVPLEMLGVRVGRVAKIDAPKGK